MARGTKHRVAGRICNGQYLPELHVECGGTWRLDTLRALQSWDGQTVIIEGVRDEFDILVVKRVWLKRTGEEIGLSWLRQLQLELRDPFGFQRTL